VKGAKVTAEVVRHGKARRSRSIGSRVAPDTGGTAGHRQPFTEVKIADVKLKD